MDYDSLISYNKDGSVDHERSNFHLLEKYAVDILKLVQEFQTATDQRLQENFLVGTVEKVRIEKIEEGEMFLLETLDIKCKHSSHMNIEDDRFKN